MDEDGKYWDFRIHGNLRGPPPNATPLQGIRVLALGGAPLDSHERCSQVSPLSKKHRSLKKQQQVYLKKIWMLGRWGDVFLFHPFVCVNIFFTAWCCTWGWEFQGAAFFSWLNAEVVISDSKLKWLDSQNAAILLKRDACSRSLLSILGGGFKQLLFAPRNLGKMSNLTNIFQTSWNHQPD